MISTLILVFLNNIYTIIFFCDQLQSEENEEVMSLLFVWYLVVCFYVDYECVIILCYGFLRNKTLVHVWLTVE